MDILAEPSEEIALRLEWNVICTIACQAFVRRITFDMAVQVMLEEYLGKLRDT